MFVVKFVKQTASGGLITPPEGHTADSPDETGSNINVVYPIPMLENIHAAL